MFKIKDGLRVGAVNVLNSAGYLLTGAANSALLGGNPPSFFTNATNLSSGRLALARLPTEAYTSANLTFGDGLTLSNGVLISSGGTGTPTPSPAAFLNRFVISSSVVSPFTMTRTASSANEVLVTLNGTRLDPANDYSVSGYTLTVTETLVNDDILIVERQSGSGASGAAANGLPTGGTAGQALLKLSATDYDASWQNIATGAASGQAYFNRFVTASSQTVFNLTTSPYNANSVIVTRNGLRLDPGSGQYSLSGTALTVSAAAAGDVIIAEQPTGGSVASVRFVPFTVNGNGAANQAITLPLAGLAANDVVVFVYGICQRPLTDYTVSGTTLTLVGTVENGSPITLRPQLGEKGETGNGSPTPSAVSVGVYCGGAPSSNEVLGSFFFPSNITLSPTASRARSTVAPSSDVTFIINLNGNQIGTILFSNGSTTGVFSYAQTTVQANDLISIVSPSASYNIQNITFKVA